MTEPPRARSFGPVAAAYEQFRPGYPEALVDEVLTYAGRPVRTALEIGAGTGKATRLFAARGLTVTASDPDPEMLAELRRHVPPTVATVASAFEDLPLEAHDLVVAAASLHWTRPEGRWTRMSSLLVPGGTFAAFGGQLHLAEPELEEAVRVARSPYLPDDEVPSRDGTPRQRALQWPGSELEGSALFADVRQRTIERRLTLSAGEYVGHLSTISAYLVLPAASREQALARIRDVLPAQVALVGDLTLHLARSV